MVSGTEVNELQILKAALKLSEYRDHMRAPCIEPFWVGYGTATELLAHTEIPVFWLQFQVIASWMFDDTTLSPLWECHGHRFIVDKQGIVLETFNSYDDWEPATARIASLEYQASA